ncbi:hypothetical protein G5C51_39545 [Streptomyces sp. A7024]|uniref:Uncharacterized protein n=1 Tax=Streptomyces coryli TaxID=1128680 RepID=A0A6G4UES1_9ACTN|nr:hypothetical protein [Streptomyces coryli]NGN69971.1 hypothetical protein [Streptomyces coryli]
MRKTVMWRVAVAIAVGVFGGITLVSLLGDGDEGGPSSSDSPSAGPRLTGYQEIALRGKGASEVAERVALDGGRVIAAAQAGKVRLFFYTEGKNCGVYVTSPNPGKDGGTIQVGAGFPDDESDDPVPGGPYESATTPGSTNPATWLDLACGKSTMYVEYDSEERAKPTDPTGPVSAANSTKSPIRSVFVVGRESTRQAVLKKVAGT